jgi:hypothetical protein
MDADTNDIASGLSACVTKDGQSGALTGNLQMGSNKITGLANGTATNDAVNFGQVFTNPTFTGSGSVSANWTVIGSLAVTGLSTLTGGATVTGVVNMASATSVSVPTMVAGTSTTDAASTAFVAAAAFSSALPAQTGNTGKDITTNGSSASWGMSPASFYFAQQNLGVL